MMPGSAFRSAVKNCSRVGGGSCPFLGMAISGLPMDKLVRPLIPFLAAAIVAVLLLGAFVPETVLIPRLLGSAQSA